ncbi:MAG: hypothetical protein JWQ19_3975 [Subtercola sp.]|jgi:hypothetical protein|nr:hypothetical protein [Subtercola sp.]
MKNFKQIAFGILVCALAIGFSSFTNASKRVVSTTNRYYNVTGIASSNPADFKYVDGLEDDCISNPTDQCTAQWSTTNVPTAGETPTQAGSPVLLGNASAGDYNGH